MSIKKETLKGVYWSLFDQVITRGIGVFVSIILARLLIPEDFGMMGMIYIFTMVSQELIDGGLSSSLIRSSQVDKKDYGTIFTTNLFISFCIYGLLYLAAPFIAQYYEIPRLTNIIRVYNLIFIINALSAVQNTILVKNLQFKKITLFNLPGILIGALLGIYLGFNNYGVWSLIYMQLATQIITACTLWIFNPNIPIYFSKSILKKHYDFGFKIMISTILNATFRNLHYVIIGKVYNIKVLGYFERAKILSSYSPNIFVGLLSKVFYPVLSKLNDDEERLNATYRQLLIISFFIIVGISVLLSVNSNYIILGILGSKWLKAAFYFKMLCLSTIFHPLHVFNLNILKVKGRSDILLRVEIINRIIGLSMVCILLPFGLDYVVCGLILVELISYYINTTVTSPLNKYPFKAQLLDLLPIVGIGITTYLSVYIIQMFTVSWNVLIALITQIMLGGLIYLGLAYLFNIEIVKWGIKNFKFKHENKKDNSNFQ